MIEEHAPIGIFDSGVGGLSVLKQVEKLMPQEDLIYFADTIHLPYGDRSEDEIYMFSETIIEFLMSLNCKAIVIACNTASAASLQKIRIKYPQYSFIGMEPAVKPAAANTISKKVGVIATVATFQGQLFKSVVERFAKDVEVFAQPCPGLVQQIEAGELYGEKTEEMLRHWLTPMVEKGIDRLVLACTHYPFVIETIRKIIGDQIEIIDPAPAVAKQLQRVLEEKKLLRHDLHSGKKLYLTSGNTEQFMEAVSRIKVDAAQTKGVLWKQNTIVNQ